MTGHRRTHCKHMDSFPKPCSAFLFRRPATDTWQAWDLQKSRGHLSGFDRRAWSGSLPKNHQRRHGTASPHHCGPRCPYLSKPSLFELSFHGMPPRGRQPTFPGRPGRGRGHLQQAVLIKKRRRTRWGWRRPATCARFASGVTHRRAAALGERGDLVVHGAA